jgi:hypothetical protein
VTRMTPLMFDPPVKVMAHGYSESGTASAIEDGDRQGG